MKSQHRRIKFLKAGNNRPNESFMVELPNKKNETINIGQAMKVYEHRYLSFLKSYANHWVSIPLGSPGCSASPASITSRVKIQYPQGDNWYCLAYSLASALDYCGFKEQGLWLWQQASYFSKLPLDTALATVHSYMEMAVPVIGGATQYMKRTGQKKIRQLTIQQVIDSPSPFLLLLVPKTKEGVPNHALCVVDDLVFDSIALRALRLCEETFLWIFNDDPITIHRGLLFNQKVAKTATNPSILGKPFCIGPTKYEIV
jgi:hypothetical protein